MNYQETLQYLYQSLPMYQKVGQTAFKKDLTNTLALLNVMGKPHQKFKSVHIAGTNGKGSTSHSLAAIFQVAGYKTGLYTSPHLKNFTERIKINGQEIPEEAVVNFVHHNRDEIEKIKPSFFEMTVAMAFDYFAKEEVDIAIIEVGLGGRLDSTNVITPEASVITNISYDHQDMLGETLVEIAGEKAGIIKPSVPVIISEKQPEIESVFQKKASDLHAPLYFAPDRYRAETIFLEADKRIVNIYFQEKIRFENLQLSLAGSYQLKNILGVLQTIEVLQNLGYKISDTDVREGIRNMKSITGLKGRWQVLHENPKIICDTAHNEAGIKLVMQQLEGLSAKHLHIVFGVVREKKLDTILNLLPKDATYYFCEAKIPRALPAQDLAEAAKKYGLMGKVITDVNEAIKIASNYADAEDIIFVGGSSFVVAEIENL